ncbi:MAG: hypothetical protein IT308_12755 [Anaerolineaceae bacterium]|nr:hypothetical protein [Anaerolineaceae bacterium]
MSKPSTVGEITRYLAKNITASTKDFSQALQLTEQNIRYHLEKMIKSGVVHAVESKELSPKSAGRKRLLYTLAPNPYPNNHARLLDATLKVLKKSRKSNLLEIALRAIAHEMFPKNGSSSSHVEQLNDAIKQLNIHHYDAHWEAGFDGPQFVFQHCPYASLLAAHPELCQLDCQILHHLTGTPYACLFSAVEPFRTTCVFSPK